MTILPFPINTPSRRAELVSHLRHIADQIEAGDAFYDHHAFLMCLTSPTHHEVLTFGYHNDLEGWRGAHAAMNAIMRASFRTEGGNIRSRDTSLYGRVSDEMPVNLAGAMALRKRGDG